MARTLSIVTLLLCSGALYAQCSDAGVCSIGTPDEGKAYQFGATYLFGRSGKADDLTFHSVEFSGSFRVFEGSQLHVSLPWMNISGPLGTVGGSGDLTLLWSQKVWETSVGKLDIQGGAHLSTGRSNARNLPQAYQPGLGTNDLLFGVTFATGAWDIALGYQRSRGRSDNSVTRLRRGDDLFGRVGAKTEWKRLEIGLDLLAVKRLHTSSVLDPVAPATGSFVDVPGSDQFQVNLLCSLSFPLTQTFGIHSHVAFPMRRREVNLDGLTRSISAGVGTHVVL